MEVNKKINEVIEWLLNDLPLLNNDTRKKLEDNLEDLAYITDLNGNNLRIEVND